MAIYMKIDGIEGNVTAKGHEGWIELHSFRFGLGRAITSQNPGVVKDREATKPSISEVVVTKTLSEDSPLFFQEATVGAAKPSVQIDFVKTADQLETYMSYTLSHVLISGYSVDASDGGRPHETISLNFDKIESKFTPIDDQHKAGSPIAASYDLTTAGKGS